MEVQLDVNKILEMTRAKLNEVTNENIMLHCLVEQQQDEVNQLKLAIDKLGEEVQHGNQNEGKQDSGPAGEEG